MIFNFPALPAGLDVSRETLDRLKMLVDLVGKWNPRINLVARSSWEVAWHRHVVDSAQLWLHVGQPQGNWLDIGSGGGFPGLVVAVIGSERSPATRFVFVESDKRKCAFLREAARSLGVTVVIENERIEALQPVGAKVVSARALAKLDRLIEYAERHLSPEGMALFLKGRGYGSELEEARKTWRFQCESSPSLTDADAAVLRVWGIQHG